MSDIKKYDEIPELTDEQALFHSKSEYTYIINAEKYQETGELETKRVLKEDLCPEASASYVFFKREGCRDYPLKEQNLYLKSIGGRYVGPFQMNSDSCNAFLKHIKETHPEWSSYIKGKGTTGYMNFVKKCPDKQEMLDAIEAYALSDYFNNRVGKPEALAENLAKKLNKLDDQDTPDATRLPLHVISALPTGVIARGNGKGFNRKIPTLNEKNLDSYCKAWISDRRNGVPAYNQLKEVDYLTPEIIAQYQTMNLSGADKLKTQYQALVDQKETQKRQKELAYMRIDLTKEIKSTIPTTINLQEFPDLYGRQQRFEAQLTKRERRRLERKLRREEKRENKAQQQTPEVSQANIKPERQQVTNLALLNSINCGR